MVYLHKKSVFKKDKAKVIFDKNPRYTIFVNLLSSIFHDAKFIRIIRDPRDNAVSSLKYNKKGVGMIAYKWLKYNQHFDRFEAKNQSISKTMKFEELVRDKQNFFKEFEHFTGVDSLLAYESIRYTEGDKLLKKFNDRLVEQHSASIKPMDQSKIGHYTKKLNEKQIQRVESISFPYASKKHGYHTDKQTNSNGNVFEVTTFKKVFISLLG